MPPSQYLASWATNILNAADPQEKLNLTFRYAERWEEERIPVGSGHPPDHPSRPGAPRLRAPRDMPKRSTGPKGRIAMIHALAHIELNAVDLAWDIVARFTHCDLPEQFYDDWVRVAAEEARHYQILERRLVSLGASYGDLPAHNGLWEAAQLTHDSLLPRLALVPMTLEARGIDTTPSLSNRIRQSGDGETAEILDEIYNDEIGHVGIGVKWFEFLCAREGKSPISEYQRQLTERFRGSPKGPFNIAGREKAGMSSKYIEPWMT